MFDLIKELENYLPYNTREAENVKKTLLFLTTSKNCYSRANLSGHVTAGGLVVDGKGNVLLNHHKRSNMWFQFGGHSDDNPNTLEVAQKEVEEESGLCAKDLRLGAKGNIFDVDVQEIPYYAKNDEPEHYHYDINFLFVTDNKKYSVSSESIEIKWVSIEKARELVSPRDMGTLRMLDKYENMLQKQNEFGGVNGY